MLALFHDLVGSIAGKLMLGEGQERTNFVDSGPDIVVFIPAQYMRSCKGDNKKNLLNIKNLFHSFNIRNLECEFVGFLPFCSGKECHLFLMPALEVCGTNAKFRRSLKYVKLTAKVELNTLCLLVII